MPFDFYLPNKNAVIEVNGQQHYYETKTFKQTLSDRQRVDNIKKEYCLKHNIKYIEIPYWLIVQSPTETYKKIIDNI